MKQDCAKQLTLSDFILLADTHAWIFYVVIAVYLIVMLPFWIIVVLKNKYTKSVLTHGWVPVLSALFISG